MNRIFVTADTHFGHEKIITFELARSIFSTIKEHDEAPMRYERSPFCHNVTTIWPKII